MPVHFLYVLNSGIVSEPQLGLVPIARRLSELDLSERQGHLFTDRRTGVYTSQGKVLKAYDNAVERNGFHLYWGPDATAKSPDMGDALLHETAASWCRRVMKNIKPDVLPWEEAQAQRAARAEKATLWTNAE